MQAFTQLQVGWTRSQTPVCPSQPCSARCGWLHRPSMQRTTIVCMAHPRRVAKVSSQIQREISEMFIYDKVVQAALCPERRVGLNDSLSAVASVTHVYVSNDLQVVKVYVSVYSDDRGKEQAINNLVRIAPYVRSRIGQALKLRLTPEIRFESDHAYDELEKIQAAIGQEDFDRYIAEAEADRRGGQPSSSSSRPADADGFADDVIEDDDSGFFDIRDDDAVTNDDDAAGPGPGSSKSVSWSKHDPATFFAVDDDEDEDGEYEGVQDDAWYARAGPFDDLFSGGGEELVKEKAPPQQQQQKRKRGKGKQGEKQLQ